MVFLLNYLLSALVSVLRFGNGSRVTSPGDRPETPVIVYEFEGCPFCRKLREALTMLDLDAEIRPCPKLGRRYRPELVKRGGKAQFPYLVDPNTGFESYESDLIIGELCRRYGRGRRGLLLSLGPLSDVLSSLAKLPRALAGTFARPGPAIVEPVELFTSENSPGGRLVRERLCVMELPYLLRTTGLGSGKREALSRDGLAVPCLVDPNTGVTTCGASAVLAYLADRYRHMA